MFRGVFEMRHSWRRKEDPGVDGDQQKRVRTTGVTINKRSESSTLDCKNAGRPRLVQGFRGAFEICGASLCTSTAHPNASGLR